MKGFLIMRHINSVNHVNSVNSVNSATTISDGIFSKKEIYFLAMEEKTFTSKKKLKKRKEK